MATQSTVASSGIDICSRSLILIGADPITSFADGTTESNVAVNVYEDVARAALVNSRWRFATNQSALATLTDKPTGRFDIAHQLPTDCLMVHAMTVNDNLVTYSIYGDKVFSNLSATDVVIADYSFRADESNWPSYFTLAVEYALAIIFSTSIARDSSLATLMQAQAERSMAKARNLDSQQQTTSKLTTSRFITSRRS